MATLTQVDVQKIYTQLRAEERKVQRLQAQLATARKRRHFLDGLLREYVEKVRKTSGR